MTSSPVAHDYLALLAQCAEEPIHVPGAVQAHGALIAFGDGALIWWSSNFEEFTGLPLAALIDQGIDALPASITNAARDLPDESAKGLVGVHSSRCRLPKGEFEVSASRAANGELVIEFEGVGEEVVLGDESLSRTLEHMLTSDDIESLAAILAERTRDLIGCDRAMVYRFDADGNGQIIAEARDAALPESFLGWHFPESDIPAQARRLYVKSWLRAIADVDAPDVQLVGRTRELPPLDLSLAALRSVSPVHVRYLQNMDVRGSLSISLIVDGALWGLIACHHYAPFRPSRSRRLAAQLLGMHACTLIAAAESKARLLGRDESDACLAQIHDALDGAASVAQGVRAGGEAWLKLLDADGFLLASDDDTVAIGQQPSEAVVEAIVLRLRGLREGLCTDRAGTALELGEAGADLPGVAAVPLASGEHGFLLWFRRPVTVERTWGGRVAKRVELDPVTGRHRLEPRRSLEIWIESARDRALPWPEWTLDVGSRVAQQILGAREHQRLRLLAEARHMSAVGELAASIAHDFNNMLTAIDGFANFIVEDLPETSASRTDAEGIRSVAANGRHLVSQLLDFARRRGSDASTVVPLRALEQDRLTFERLLGPAMTLTLDLHPPEVEVALDPVHFEQVIINLLANARDACERHGQVRVGADVQSLSSTRYLSTGHLLRAGTYQRIRVSDDGPGIDAAALPRILEAFFTTKETGSGIGLATCNAIVRRAQGGIHVDTGAAGAAFEIWLPCASATPMPNRAPEKSAPQESTQSVSCIWLVDDEPAVLTVLARLVQRSGHSTRTFSRGQDALSAWDAGDRPDLLMTDQSMPGMSGLELIEAMQARNPELPALLVSGFPGDEITQHARSGRIRVLQKPAPPGAIRDALQQLLEGND